MIGGICILKCGDGILDLNEECDDSNLAIDDGCSATCRVERGWTCTGIPSVCTSFCGNRLVRPGVEECDDGNMFDDDGCSSICTLNYVTDAYSSEMIRMVSLITTIT